MSKPLILELKEKVERLEEKNVILAYQTNAQIANQNQTVNLQNCTKVGERLTLTNNEIIIGKGINYIKIKAQIFFEYIPDMSYFFIQIRKNGVKIAEKLNDYRPGAAYYTATVECLLCEVEEGDKITLNFGDINDKQPTTRLGKMNTYLFVEEI